ncbi:MAG TPA: Fic family protein [Solirubrobacterales bacterium]|nr:Fic family protein [Solirubrobacterales bacterium]
MKTFRELEKHLGMVPAPFAAALGTVSAGHGREEILRHRDPRAIDALREAAMIQSTAASNAIEQITAPAPRIVELVRDEARPQNRSEEEITGYRDVLGTIHESAEQIPFTPSVVLQFHRDLYARTAIRGGRFKNVQNEVARFDPSGKRMAVIFRGTPPSETPRAMDELHERFAMAVADGRHAPLLLAGAYVFDFLMVHPFNDGNGRMSRLLTLLLLYQAGHDIGRFVSLERLVEESKETYYEALQASTAGWDRGEHDIWPWLDYFLGILIGAYRQLEEYAAGLGTGRGSKATRIRSFVRLHIADTFTSAEVRDALPDVGVDHIRAELRKLRDAGVVESPGRGRKHWRRLRSDF